MTHLAHWPSHAHQSDEKPSTTINSHPVLRRHRQGIDIWVGPDASSASKTQKTSSLPRYQTFVLPSVMSSDPIDVWNSPSAGELRSTNHSFDCTATDQLRLWISRDLISDECNFSEPQLIEDVVARELTLALMYSLAKRARGADDTRDHIVNALCARLQSCSYSSYELEVSPSSPFHDWQLRVVEQALANACELDVSVEVVAKRCRLSACHFARRFKLKFGITFHRYVVRTRVARSQTLLTTTGLPISQIALDVGFADQSSFTRCFTSRIGMPPGRWRASTEPRFFPLLHADNLQESSFTINEVSG